MPVNDEQRVRVLEFIQEGLLTSEQIAEKVGISLGTLAAVRAKLKMGRYAYGSVVPTNEAAEEAEEIVFSLEKDMQMALRANIEQLEAGLKIIDGGNERKNTMGWIDITASDTNGSTVVIELKAGIASPEALTQVMAYVGAIAEEEGKAPRAILIAQDFHKKVVYAANVIPGLQLLKYGFTFKFTPQPKAQSDG